MTKALALLISSFALFVALLTSAWAAPLTVAEAGRFIDSLAALQNLEQNEQLPIDPESNLSPFSTGLASLAPEDPLRKQLIKISKNHGFNQVENWAQVGDRVVQAYVLASIGMPIQELQKSLEQTQAMLNDPNLPDEMRQMFAGTLNNQLMQQFQNLSNSEQDIPAITPHINKLNQLVSQDE